MSTSYDPPEIPELDPEDFEYMIRPPTQEELDEVALYISERWLRKNIKSILTRFNDPTKIKGYLLDAVYMCPTELPALRCVLQDHFPQYLKFFDCARLLQ